jgi:hypothetical protein
VRMPPALAEANKAASAGLLELTFSMDGFEPVSVTNVVVRVVIRPSSVAETGY